MAPISRWVKRRSRSLTSSALSTGSRPPGRWISPPPARTHSRIVTVFTPYCWAKPAGLAPACYAAVTRFTTSGAGPLVVVKSYPAAVISCSRSFGRVPRRQSCRCLSATPPMIGPPDRAIRRSARAQFSIGRRAPRPTEFASERPTSTSAKSMDHLARRHVVDDKLRESLQRNPPAQVRRRSLCGTAAVP